ncbi:Heat shock protein beta-1 [Halotydeus destructor]|nr:Heat shock protein beta-1 [Halotydeus destructor]
MSNQLIPHRFNSHRDWFDNPDKFFDHDFGRLELFDKMDTWPEMRKLNDDWRTMHRTFEQRMRQLRHDLFKDDIRDENGKFQVSVDVKHFKPEEVSVSCNDDGLVTISGSHEERTDGNGYVSRQFTRKYVLPREVEAEKVICDWGVDGTLSIEAPKKRPTITELPSSERNVPIGYDAKYRPKSPAEKIIAVQRG